LWFLLPRFHRRGRSLQHIPVLRDTNTSCMSYDVFIHVTYVIGDVAGAAQVIGMVEVEEAFDDDVAATGSTGVAAAIAVCSTITIGTAIAGLCACISNSIGRGLCIDSRTTLPACA